MNRFLAFILVAGCATAPTPDPLPLKVTILPPLVDLDKVLPPTAPAKIEIPPDIKRFDDLPVDGGKLCTATNKCQDVLPGILVDEATYAQGIADQSTLKRVNLELRTFRTLRTEEHKLIHEAETAYQTHIVELRKENAELRRPKLSDQLRFIGAFILGAGVATATAYSAAKVVK